MKTEGSRVLVTGAGGFIGSHLTEALVQCGASVRALVHYNSRNDWGMLEELSSSVRSEIDIVSGDVRDPVLVRSVAKGCAGINTTTTTQTSTFVNGVFKKWLFNKGAFYRPGRTKLILCAGIQIGCVLDKISAAKITITTNRIGMNAFNR